MTSHGCGTFGDGSVMDKSWRQPQHEEQETMSEIAYVNESRVISLLDVVEDWGFIEAGQLGHVFHLVKLGWIHLLQIVLWNMAAFASFHDLHFNFVSSLSLDGSWDKSKVVVWDPHQSLLGPFRLGGRVIEGISVHNQVFEVRIISIQAGVGVRHFVTWRNSGNTKKKIWAKIFEKQKTQTAVSRVPHTRSLLTTMVCRVLFEQKRDKW